MKDFLHHLFIPRESNNYRAKLLHHKSLIVIITVLFIGQFFVAVAKNNFSSVLGISSDISSQELLLLVNQKRLEKGLPVLVLNDVLSKAAALKANDMFVKNYWAHNSPDGLTPWVFIKKEGYEYSYAGENLARGFTNAEDVVDAWMDSPSHKENILSKNYRDIGFAIAQGKLLGEETVLVVEMFGNTSAPLAKQTAGESTVNIPKAVSKDMPSQAFSQTLINPSKPLLDSSFLSRNIGLFMLMLFIFVFALDLIVIKRKKVARIVGHNLDHIFFLTGAVIFVLIFGRGIIL